MQRLLNPCILIDYGGAKTFCVKKFLAEVLCNAAPFIYLDASNVEA
jgi:hypothetical protein